MNRRSFLKKLGIGAAAAAVITNPMWTALEEVGLEELSLDPDIASVLERLPGLKANERESVIRFVAAEIKSGNWKDFEAFYFYGFEDEELTKINWKGDGK